MPIQRRQFLRVATSAAALAAVSRTATAQTYPAQPSRIIVGFAAGGATDIVARLMAQWLSDRLGQPYIVENRLGAGGNIAAEAVVRAPPDGHTLLLVGSTNAINTTLYERLSFNIVHDIAPVASVMFTPLTMDVHPSVPVKTVPEFIAYAKANPGKLNMGSGGIGTPQHVCGELFKLLTGVDMVHVPYRGGAPAVADLLGGQIQVMFDVMPESIEHIRAGRLRTLAVTTAVRSPALPDTPALSDFVPGYEASAWWGIGVPRATPVDIITKLNREINAALADPGMKPRLAALGGTALPGGPADFGKLLAEDTEKWSKVVKFSGAKVD